MALTLYRRHRRECKGGHPYQFRSSEFEERKRGWKRCECPITASGTLHGKYRRQSTGAWEWQAALAVVAAWEQAGSWTSPLQRPVVAKEIPSASRITITEATQGFLDKIEGYVEEAAIQGHRIQSILRR